MLNAVTQVLLKDVAVAMISEVATETLRQAKEEQQLRFRLTERKMRVVRARRHWNRSVGVSKLTIGWVGGGTATNILIACKLTVIMASCPVLHSFFPRFWGSWHVQSSHTSNSTHKFLMNDQLNVDVL